MRLKSREACAELVASLQEHMNAVWPEQGKGMTTLEGKL